MDIFDHLHALNIDLDPEQQAAVCHERGSLLVIAVPGSGKTTVLVSRIARLLMLKLAQRGNVLTLTFNRSAARDMKERFSQLFGELFPRLPQFSTLHSLCFQIIKSAGLPPPQIEESGRMRLIRDLLREMAGRGALIVPEEDVLNAANALSYIKNRMLPPEDYGRHGLSVPFPRFVERYDQAMTARGWMDFDDMLLRALELLRQPQLLAQWQQQFTHILVDEAQDLSPVQHAVLQLLSQRAQSLFMVGDEDQSIYSFRGSSPESLLSFASSYPQARVLRMQTNYRSLPAIVEKADSFIRINTARYPKTMVPSLSGSAHVESHTFASKQQQYSFILDRLAQLPPGQSSAILYRSHLSAVPLVDRFLRAGLPFTCRESGRFFFTHPVTQDLRAFLELALDPCRRDAFEAVYYKFNAFLSREMCRHVLSSPPSMTVWEALAAFPGLNPYQRARIDKKRALFAALPSLPPARAMEQLLQEGEYQLYLTQSPAVGVSSYAALAQWDALASIAEGLSTLPGFLDRLDYLESSLPDWDRLSAEGAPLFSTVHGAKGLEFDQVFVLDLVENQFPSAGADLAEEARLFYVAITRARRILHLGYALPGPASPFLTRMFPPAPAPITAPRRKRGRTAPQPPRTAAPAVDFSAYPPGQGVRHSKWGPGVVEAADPARGRLQVRFPGGVRTLSLAHCLAHGLLETREFFDEGDPS